MASSPLTDLSTDIAKNAAIIADFYREAGVDQPSFSPNAQARFPSGAGEDVLAARSQLIYTARQMQFLALGPTESLQWFALTGVSTYVFSYVWRWDHARLPRRDEHHPSSMSPLPSDIQGFNRLTNTATEGTGYCDPSLDLPLRYRSCRTTGLQHFLC